MAYFCCVYLRRMSNVATTMAMNDINTQYKRCVEGAKEQFRLGLIDDATRDENLAECDRRLSLYMRFINSRIRGINRNLGRQQARRGGMRSTRRQRKTRRSRK